MTTSEEWNRLFFRLVEIVSIGIGSLSLALGTMALLRTDPLGRRVYSRDGRYLVSVRSPGELNDIRDFVQPSNPNVVAVYSQFGPAPWNLFDFVCRNVNYRRDVGERWQFPSETLKGYGDCEDTSILLASLIKAGGPNCYVALGYFQGYAHAWVN